VTAFINAGGNLFLSGSEIGWDLDSQNNGRTFYESTLKANYVSDEAGTYTATADAGGIFAGMSSFVFSSGTSYSQRDSQVYDVASPDVIAPQAGAVCALLYSGGQSRFPRSPTAEARAAPPPFRSQAPAAKATSSCSPSRSKR